MVSFSNLSYACILGPDKLDASNTDGFKFELSPNESCDNCVLLEITAPDSYKEQSLAYMLFSTYVDEKIKSKILTSRWTDTDGSDFGAVITKDPNTRFEISILYGTGRCMSYEFTYTINN